MKKRVIFVISLLLLIIILLLIIFKNLFNTSFNPNNIQTINPISKPKEKAIRPITIDLIFSSKHNLLENLDKDRIITLIATGDIIPARTVNYQTIAKNNFLWPYKLTADFLKSADITLINLESPLINNCPVTNEGMVFCGHQKNIHGLKFAGIDIASLANNHSTNYGTEGINQTIQVLNKANILTTGVNGPVYKETRNTRFAFLGYNDIPPLSDFISISDEKKIIKEVKNAKENSDIVVVSFHWGVEYVSQPNERQKKLARLAIDSGADLIIGNHPHWIQPVEIYKDKFIAYAHGNFIFDQMWSEKTKEGVVGKYTFYNKQLIDVEFFPTYIVDYGQPHFLQGDRKTQILNGMKQESQILFNSNF
ncbi:CapA family protein [Candidatus Parcubacteria bacterium]|nr:MAG: CapA family protein [Candidatus Parcubacteria bacterium]